MLAPIHVSQSPQPRTKMKRNSAFCTSVVRVTAPDDARIAPIGSLATRQKTPDFQLGRGSFLIKSKPYADRTHIIGQITVAQ